MRVLVVDDRDILHKGEYDAEAVVILFDWGYKIITKQPGSGDYIVDLDSLLRNPKITERHLWGVKEWLEKHRGGH